MFVSETFVQRYLDDPEISARYEGALMETAPLGARDPAGLRAAITDFSSRCRSPFVQLGRNTPKPWPAIPIFLARFGKVSQVRGRWNRIVSRGICEVLEHQ